MVNIPLFRVRHSRDPVALCRRVESCMDWLIVLKHQNKGSDLCVILYAGEAGRTTSGLLHRTTDSTDSNDETTSDRIRNFLGERATPGDQDCVIDCVPSKDYISRIPR